MRTTLLPFFLGLSAAEKGPRSLGMRRAAHIAAHAKQCADSLALYPAPAEGAPRLARASSVTTRTIATGGGGGDRGAAVGVLSTIEPVFTRAACEAVIAEAEAEAAQSGGWKTTRHKRHPAADISLERLPRTREWLAAELDACLAPALSAWFPALLPEPRSLRVVDGFVVRCAQHVREVPRKSCMLNTAERLSPCI